VRTSSTPACRRSRSTRWSASSEFFLPDIAAAIAELWRLVRPGGTLAITIWGPDFLEPATTAFWAAVGTERPDLVGAFHPWTRVTDPAALERLLAQAGVAAQAGGADPAVEAEPGVEAKPAVEAEPGVEAKPAVEAESGTHPLARPDDWWTIVLGTGYRATVEQLDVAAARRVRTANVTWLRRHDIRELQANVIYARARRQATT
jgi:SAM-dependent methyltransferase